jgi:hypothetical protein
MTHCPKCNAKNMFNATIGKYTIWVDCTMCDWKRVYYNSEDFK